MKSEHEKLDGYYCVDEGSDNKDSETFIDRLQIEFDELQEKMTLLNQFLISDSFRKLDDQSQHLMQRQHVLMSEYADVLNRRMAIALSN